MNYFEEFKKLLGAIVKPGVEITEETELKTLGIDSLDLVQVLTDAEEKYDILFDDEELNGFIKVSDIVKAIEAKLK